MKQMFIIVAILVSLLCVDVNEPFAQEDLNTSSVIVTDQFGFEMVYVPSGTVQMGVDSDVFQDMVTNGIFHEFSGINSIAIAKTYGIFETYESNLPGFWIDKFEVTVSEYENVVGQCLSTNSCSDNQLPQLLKWNEAVDFCAIRGSRLPTEEEWEYAASGPENLIFPWGNDLDLEILNSQGYTEFNLYEVGSHPLNVSWIGIYDLAGNAEEWTDNLFQPYYSWEKTTLTDWNEVNPEFWRVVRGGASEDGIMLKTTYSRQGSFYGDAGVRCARFSHPNGE